MAAAPGSSVIEGLRTLEVRWLLPGRLDAAVAGWFGRFPAEAESREDTAALIFDRALPSGAELGLGGCRSYAEWLSCTTCRS